MSKPKFSLTNTLLNSRILQSEPEIEFSQEEIIYYKRFISKKSLKKAEIISTENIEETFQMTYTVHFSQYGKNN